MNDSVDARVSKYKGTGEFLFMKLDGKFHWKFCFKPSLVKRTIIVLLRVLILMVYSTFRVYSISLSTFNHDKKYHWPFNIVKIPQVPPPPFHPSFYFPYLIWVPTSVFIFIKHVFLSILVRITVQDGTDSWKRKINKDLLENAVQCCNNIAALRRWSVVICCFQKFWIWRV